MAGAKACNPDLAKRGLRDREQSCNRIRTDKAHQHVDNRYPEPKKTQGIRREGVKQNPNRVGGGGGTSTLTHVPECTFHSTRCTNDKVYGTKVSVCDYEKVIDGLRRSGEGGGSLYRGAGEEGQGSSGNVWQWKGPNVQRG